MVQAIYFNTLLIYLLHRIVMKEILSWSPKLRCVLFDLGILAVVVCLSWGALQFMQGEK